jgi:uncharacterized protein
MTRAPGLRRMSGPSCEVWNRTRGVRLADRVVMAETAAARMRGLLGRTGLDAGEGLWIRPCNSIHMFFMRFPIDALFLSKEMRVVRGVAGLKPWRIAGPVGGASSVLELPAGVLAASGCQAGDLIEVRPAAT